MSKNSIDRQAAIDEICLAWCGRKYDDCVHISDFKLGCYYCDGCSDVQAIMDLPPVQPDIRLEKIADLVDGSIDHFDLEDAMDLLYQIKDVLNG